MKQLLIDRNELAYWNALLAMDEIDFDSEGIEVYNGVVKSWLLDFGDGVEAELHVCRTNGENALWSEMVWFRNGVEINCSEVNYAPVTGEWGFEGDETHPDYSVNVMAK